MCAMFCAVEVCEEGDVRLVDSNIEGGGRVELCLGNEWRSVGDETWGIEEASVVCRQLQLPGNGKYDCCDECTYQSSHIACELYGSRLCRDCEQTCAAIYWENWDAP